MKRDKRDKREEWRVPDAAKAPVRLKPDERARLWAALVGGPEETPTPLEAVPGSDSDGEGLASSALGTGGDGAHGRARDRGRALDRDRPDLAESGERAAERRMGAAGEGEEADESVVRFAPGHKRSGKGRAKGAPQGFDFRSATRFSNEHLRSMARVHDHMTTLLRTFLGVYLRVGVQVSAANVEASTYEQFMDRVARNHMVAVLDVPPLRGRSLLTLEQGFAMTIIDRLLGGPGLPTATLRPPTEIEVRVLRRIIPIFLESFQQAFASLVPVRPSLESIETNPQFLRIAAPDETVVFTSLDVAIGESHGMLGYCLPYPALEPILPRLTAKAMLASPDRLDLAATPEVQRRMSQSLLGAPVTVTAELGRASLTAQALADLEVGDYLPVARRIDDPVRLYVGGVLKFEGRLGNYRRHVAVEVTRVHEEEDH